MAQSERSREMADVARKIFLLADVFLHLNWSLEYPANGRLQLIMAEKELVKPSSPLALPNETPMRASMHRFRLISTEIAQDPLGNGDESQREARNLKRKHDEEPRRSSKLWLPACDRCRQSKKKCSKTLPECQACITAGRQCSFLLSPPEESTKENLEARVRLLSNYIKKNLPASLESANSPSEVSLVISPSAQHEPAASWPKSPGSEVPRSEKGPSLANLLQGDEQVPSINSSPEARPRNSDKTVQHISSPRRRHQQINDSSLARNFVEAYFRHVHRAYPFMDRTKMLEELEAIPQSGREPSHSLNLIMAIGCTTLERAGQVQSESTVSMFDLDPTKILQEALVEYESFESIETLILLSLWSLFEPKASVWTIVGALTRQAVLLGLSRKPSPEERLSLPQTELRYRLFWSVFVLDRMLSFSLGLHVGMIDHNLDVPLVGVTVDEFAIIDRGRLAADLRTSRHVISLRQIEEKILEKIHLAKHSSITSYSLADKKVIAGGIRTEIENWYSQGCLVSPLATGSSDTSNVPFHSSVSWLSARYYNLLVMLYYPSHFNQDDNLLPRAELLKYVQQYVRASSMLLVQRQLPLNWITLYRMVPVCLVLLHCFGDGTDQLGFTAEQEVLTCAEILEAFSPRWVAARSLANTFRQFLALITSWKTQLIDTTRISRFESIPKATSEPSRANTAWLLAIRAQVASFAQKLLGRSSAYNHILTILHTSIEPQPKTSNLGKYNTTNYPELYDDFTLWPTTDMTSTFL